MKLATITAAITALLFAISPASAQSSKGDTTTIRATIISLPNAEATEFSVQHDLHGNAAEALTALETLVRETKATPIGNLAVTTKNGQRAVSESGKIFLEVEPTVSADQKSADLNIVVSEDGHKVVTSVIVSNGDAIFLGSVQNSKDQTATDYIFVRVSF